MALPPKAGPGLPFGGTLPDPLPVAAWVAVDWIEGENVRSTWRTALGYLVLTNLRCFGISRARELFPPRPWHVGPVFFFYNFRPPEVLYGRFVELAEERDDSREVGRFPEACEVERRMFESMLKAKVTTSHRVVAGDPVCRFLIRPRREDP